MSDLPETYLYQDLVQCCEHCAHCDIDTYNPNSHYCNEHECHVEALGLCRDFKEMNNGAE